MNTKKLANSSYKISTKAVLQLAICASAMFTIIPSHAQSGSDNSSLAWANSLKNVYKANSTNSTIENNKKLINQDGMANENCKSLLESKKNAASAYILNKTPPDPTKAIENSSCFIDVMDIKIPTTGNGFLDNVMKSVSPFMKSNSCNKTKNWWGDAKQKLESGQFSSLGGSFSSALSAVKDGNGVTSYATDLSGKIQSFSDGSVYQAPQKSTLSTRSINEPVFSTEGYVTPGTTSRLGVPGGAQGSDRYNANSYSPEAQSINQNNQNTQSNITSQVNSLRSYLGLQ